MFYAVLVTCYIEAGGLRECQDFTLPDPFRTISDCLIAVEKADQGLRRIHSELHSGTCTVEAPV